MFDRVKEIRANLKEIYQLVVSADKSLAAYGDSIIDDTGRTLRLQDLRYKFVDLDMQLKTIDDPKLRKVRVYAYKKVSDFKGGGWDKQDMGIGVFHGYGVGYKVFEDKLKHFSSAIVEMQDGSIRNVEVQNIKFINPALKEG